MKKQIIDTIKKYDTIIIHRHVRPDPDALGSQNGLKEILLASFPNKKVYAVGEDDPSLTFLAEMDQIDDAVYKDALVITCDTANTARVSDQRYKLGEMIIKIDHHPNNDPYGDLLWINTDASSTSEMIYELYSDMKTEGLILNDNAARLLYAGIVGDTGRFLFPSTTNKTFHYAAELINYKFDRTELYRKMYDVSRNVARLKGYVLEHHTLSENGLSTITLSKETLEKLGVDILETSMVVGVLGDIKDILAWVFFIEEDHFTRVRIRSKGPVINEVANQFHGGGHPMASGASAYSLDEKQAIIEALDEVCKTYQEKKESAE